MNIQQSYDLTHLGGAVLWPSVEVGCDLRLRLANTGLTKNALNARAPTPSGCALPFEAGERSTVELTAYQLLRQTEVPFGGFCYQTHRRSDFGYIGCLAAGCAATCECGDHSQP